MPVNKIRYITRVLSLVSLLMIPVWLFVLQPYIYKLPDDFSFTSDVISFDNFYDQERETFSGEQRSVTTFSYTTKDVENETQVIENVFDVKTVTGEQIISISRNYVIDRYTGKHVFHPLYEKRNGYLFAPRMRGFSPQIEDKDSFYYWHVNYNQAILLDFFEEKVVSGLPVYVYQANLTVDQTKELSGVLPGVGTKYGMKLFVNIQVWIEPFTGRMISYQDKTDAVYTDFETGQELFPWNSFRNTVTPHSVSDNANAASLYKQRTIFANIAVLVLLVLLAMMFFFWNTVQAVLSIRGSFASPSKTRRFLIPASISIIVLIGFSILGFVIYQIIEQQRLSEFENEANIFVSSIETRLDIYNSALEGAVGLFNASDEVDRNEWKLYVESLDLQSRYPGIQGLGYAIIVPTSSKQNFIDAVKAEGFQDFTITPNGDRDSITSIVYLEPFNDRNRRAFGYDMFSEETRRIAMIFARDSGEAGISGKITLLQETNEKVQPGFLMYLGVYENPEEEKTVENRRNSIVGYVYSPFRMNDFMRGGTFTKSNCT